MKTTEEVFKKRYEGQLFSIPLEDIPQDFLKHGSNLKIMIESDPGYYSDNNSWDPYTEVVIYQERDMTPEEVEKHKLEVEERKKELRGERYQSYLKLKQEFEQ